jgi:hypothetical protein
VCQRFAVIESLARSVSSSIVSDPQIRYQGPEERRPSAKGRRVKNGNTASREAIAKPVLNCPAFEVQKDLADFASGYQEITRYMIFDIKMEKAWTPLRRRRTQDQDPSGDDYSSVVSRDSVRIAFNDCRANDLMQSSMPSKCIFAHV